MNMPFQSLDEYITTHNALNFERYIPATSGGNHDWSDIFIWTGAGAIKPIGDSLIKFSWETVCSDSKGNFNEVIQQSTGEAMFLKSF